jgi:hypothetical protein
MKNYPIHHPIILFLIKALVYALILLVLIYLYGYFGAGQEPFIYNEF